MKLAIIITTFNRAAYLRQCLNSLRSAVIPEGTLFIIVDDASTDNETIELIKDFHPKGADVLIHYNERNSSVSQSLKTGYNKAFAYGCDVVMNLDSDAIARADFIQVLTDLKNYFPTKIVSGFHSINRNKNGTDRHPIIQKSEKWATKKSVGGINMMMSQEVFRKYMESTLDKVIRTGQGNWDYLTCVNCLNDNNPVAVSIPSVVQHIGFSSAMGHTGGEEPDVASDFVGVTTKPLSLPTVTLIAIEGVNLNLIRLPLEASTKFIEYGAVKLLSPFTAKDLDIIAIRPLKSKEEYSKFIFRELINYVDTDYALTIQHDGYVVNYSAWRDEFLQYDYIGAVWNWYGENCVGNGGFSLRSRKLIEICASDDVMTEQHPEDHCIGRTYRNYLEKHHGIKFAPKEVADKFSLEAYSVKPPGNKYAGSFGFHGKSVDFRNVDLVFNPSKMGTQSRGEMRRQERKMRYTGMQQTRRR